MKHEARLAGNSACMGALAPCASGLCASASALQPRKSAHLPCNPAMLRLPIHPASLNLHFSYWNITNGQGLSQEVRGLGVVGQHPELAPGESFTYQSGECGHLRWLSVVLVGLRWSSVFRGRPTCLLANLGLPCNRGWQQQQAGMPCRMSGARPLSHERDLASCKRHRTLTHLFPVPTPRGSMQGNYEFYSKVGCFPGLAFCFTGGLQWKAPGGCVGAALPCNCVGAARPCNCVGAAPLHPPAPSPPPSASHRRLDAGLFQA